jgi:gliding motility-associated-like protein
MRLISLLLIYCFSFSLLSSVYGQGFTFNCTRDITMVGCGPTGCLNIQALIPDIHGQTNTYTLNPLPVLGVPACSPTYIPADDPGGVPTNLNIDDRYSAVINMGFPFPFYGTIYNSLVASTNGYVSFDVSLGGLFSHWNNNGNLPNTLYDRALIMGPYHDLFPGQPTSPFQRVQYQTIGSAPTRKWVLSFFKVPLFSCTSLIENTHQIILYESTGIIEVKIFDMQICSTWPPSNPGTAMVGIQDFTRTQALMAPGRRMTDPPWGSIGINESWRFVPNGGPSLLKRVELFTVTGVLIATGTTSPSSTGTLLASFPNICPPPGPTTTYIVKSVYEKIDDPSVEVFGTDTIRVNRAPATVSATATTTDAVCNGSLTGTITVSTPAPGNPPYRYSLDGINWQASNVFPNLPAGTYTIYFEEGSGCGNITTATINQPTALASSFTSTPVVCNGQNNGIINMSASGGIAPYEFSLDGGIYQSSGTFNTVLAGPHIITIRDANGCLRTQNVNMTQPLVLALNGNTATASCDGGNDGLIIVNAAGGNSNYQYSIDGVTYQSSDTFRVVPGSYTITVKDNLNCTATRNFTVGLTSNLSHTPLTDPTICEGSSTQINFVSNATNYTWSPSVGLSNANSANTVANPVATQQYIVSYTLGRCTEEDTVVVNVNAAPIPRAGPAGFICYGQAYNLRGSGGVIYNWTPATFLNSTIIASPVARPDNTITYRLSVIDANGCPSLVVDTVTVDVTPPIKVRTYPQDTIVHAGDQFQLLATSVAPNYNWTPGYDLDRTDIPNPVITIDKDVILVVTASSQAGCIGEASIRIQVYKGPDLYPPTGFTPNGDGLNDKFYPFPVGIQELKYFKVFNRWGQLVFSTNKLWDGWDGRLGGREQASGTYAWIAQGVTRDGRVITKKGTIVLIR